MNLSLICHRCDSCAALPKNGGCRGPCACLADPQRRDIIELAQLHFCPLGKFPNRLYGDWIALLARVTGLKWLHWKWRQFKAPPDVIVPKWCDTCVKKQEWANRQHQKRKDRRKRRRHARVLRRARRMERERAA